MQPTRERTHGTAAGETRSTPARARWGAAAEARAAEYLRLQGLSVIARNLRCKVGELDLVCLDGEILVIVEVRLRHSDDYGGALASVTWRKRRKLIRATRYFWQRHAAWRARRLRFDVVALGAPTTGPQVTWIKDAFRAS